MTKFRAALTFCSYAVQQPASQKVFGDVGVNAAWKTKPSWYVVASEDNAINPELEKRMAKRANAKNDHPKEQSRCDALQTE